MNCPKCNQLFNDKEYVPLNLPCGHTYCLKCIKSTQRREINIECIYCSQVK